MSNQFNKKSKDKHKQKNYYPKHFGQAKQPAKRSNVTKKKYSNTEVDKLRTLVALQNKGNNRKYYSIKVDGEVVVPKTNNPNSFDDFTQFVDQGTQAVEIHLYHGHSNNCNKHILYFNEAPQAVNGVSPEQINEIVKNAIEEDRKLNHLEYMEKRLKELEEENESLYEEIAELNSKTDLAALGDLAKAGLNAWAVSKNGGTLGAAPQSEAQPESEVEVEPEQEQESSEEDAPHDKAKSELTSLADRYDAESVKILAHFTEKMLNTPEMQQEVQELIKKYAKRGSERGSKRGREKKDTQKPQEQSEPHDES